MYPNVAVVSLTSWEKAMRTAEAMENKATRERWVKLCKIVGAKDNLVTGKTINSTYDELFAAYANPHRHYHNLNHISDGLTEIEEIRHLAKDPDSLEMAWWFHDTVYNVRNPHSENEMQSALYGRRILLALGLTTEFWLKIMKLILATTHDHIPKKDDAWLIVDIDLISLASSPTVFNRHTAEIREEYREVAPDDKDFNVGRVRFFKKFLENRSSIYLTEYFRNKYEAKARENIGSYLAKFEKK